MDMSSALKKLFNMQKVERPLPANLLFKAKTEFENLKTLSGTLRAHGLSINDLPDDDTLLSFAYLLDYDRANQVKALDVYPARLKQLLNTKSISEISTPKLRLLNTVSLALDSILPLQHQMSNLDVDSLEPLGSLFRSIPSVKQSYWSKVILKAKVSNCIGNIAFKFEGLAASQSPHLYSIPSNKTNYDDYYDFVSEPFFFDEGRLRVIGRDIRDNTLKVKNIPFIQTNFEEDASDGLSFV